MGFRALQILILTCALINNKCSGGSIDNQVSPDVPQSIMEERTRIFRDLNIKEVVS